MRPDHLDRLTIDDLARIYGVHRATAARWVAAAHEAVLDGCKRALAERLGLSTSELDSIIALVQSQLDISVHRYL